MGLILLLLLAVLFFGLGFVVKWFFIAAIIALVFAFVTGRRG